MISLKLLFSTLQILKIAKLRVILSLAPNAKLDFTLNNQGTPVISAAPPVPNALAKQCAPHVFQTISSFKMVSVSPVQMDANNAISMAPAYPALTTSNCSLITPVSPVLQTLIAAQAPLQWLTAIFPKDFT